MKKSILSVLALVLALGMVLAGCTTPTEGGSTAPEVSSEASTDSSTAESSEDAGESSEEPAANVDASNPASALDADTLYVGTTAHNGLYNYMYASSSYDVDVCNLIYEALAVEAPDGVAKVNDRLVAEHSISDDGLDYTFKLKEGITFSDGSALTAEDVVFTFQVLAASQNAYRVDKADPLRGIEEYRTSGGDFTAVEAVDELTVVFHFAENLRTNMSTPVIKIISKDYYPDWTFETSDDVMNDKMNQPMGSGPYTLKEYAPSQFCSLTMNENYWAKDSTDYRVKNIVIKFIETTTEIDEIVTGSVDVIPQIIDRDHVDRVRNDQDGRGAQNYINLIQFKRSAYGYIGFNTRSGISSDVAMRQAIAYAFNRQEFVEAMYGDLARTLPVPMSQASSIFESVLGELNQYEFDLEKAKQVLLDAGYTFENDVMSKDGVPVELKFLASTGNTVIDAMIPVLSDNLAQIGISLNAQPIEFASLLDTVRSENDDWNMFFMASSWTSDEPNEWYASFHPSFIPSSNMTRYNNAEVAQNLVDGQKILDIHSQEAVDLYSKIAIQLNNDLPELPVYANTLTAMVNTRVHDLNIDTFNEWSNAMEGVYIE